MLTTLLALSGLVALRVGVPILMMLLLSEALLSLETHLRHERLA